MVVFSKFITKVYYPFELNSFITGNINEFLNSYHIENSREATLLNTLFRLINMYHAPFLPLNTNCSFTGVALRSVHFVLLASIVLLLTNNGAGSKGANTL